MTWPGDPRAMLQEQNCVRGDAHSYTITITRTNPDGSTSPVDLTAYGTTWTAQLRGEPDFTTFTPWAVDSSNAAQGVLVLSLTGATTAAMPPHETGSSPDDDYVDTYTYDVQVTGGSVSPQTPFMGVFRLWKDYTRG